MQLHNPPLSTLQILMKVCGLHLMFYLINDLVYLSFQNPKLLFFFGGKIIYSKKCRKKKRRSQICGTPLIHIMQQQQPTQQAG